MVLQFNYESTLPNGWVIVPHNLSQREDDVLAIDTVNKAVVWLSQNCLRVIRSYSLHSLPLHATFCAFDAPTHGNPASSSSGSDSDTNRDNHSRLHRGIAILVTHTYLQLHMLSGESYDLQLSVPMQTMVALPRGLLFHAVTSDDDSNGDSTRTANTNGGDTSITIDDINLTMDTIRSSHIHRGNQEKTETLYSLLYPTQSVISVRDSAM